MKRSEKRAEAKKNLAEAQEKGLLCESLNIFKCAMYLVLSVLCI